MSAQAAPSAPPPGANPFAFVWILFRALLAAIAGAGKPGGAEGSLVERMLIQAEAELELRRLACVRSGREDLVDLAPEARAKLMEAERDRQIALAHRIYRRALKRYWARKRARVFHASHRRRKPRFAVGSVRRIAVRPPEPG